MYDPNPLLSEQPFPQWRKGRGKEKWLTTGEGGGFFAYIRALNPGIPPTGWRDITPYFGGVIRFMYPYKRRALQRGYLLAKQTVTQNGLTYRRVAVALAGNKSAINAVRKDRNT